MTIKTRIGEGGRLVIPSAIRDALAIRPGDEVLVMLDGDGMRIVSLKAAIAHAQALVRAHVPAGVHLADDLLADRRREASGG
jgi:AbrB family looped-hinge helix DNA binding protein